MLFSGCRHDFSPLLIGAARAAMWHGDRDDCECIYFSPLLIGAARAARAGDRARSPDMDFSPLLIGAARAALRACQSDLRR